MKLNINLLPPQRKEKWRFLKTAHLVLKSGVNILFALVVFCVFLYFFLFSLKNQTRILQAEWERLEKTEDYLLIEKNKQMASEYSSYAQKLEKNFSINNFFYWQILDKLDTFLPEQVFLKEIFISENRVVVKGKCVEREDFLKFKEALEKEPLFSEVKSPISNFTSSQNVEFEIAFQVKNLANNEKN